MYTKKLLKCQVGALFALARQYKDPIFNRIIKKIAKNKLEKENTGIYQMTKMLQEKEGIELETYSEFVVDKICDEFSFVNERGMKKGINALDLEYIMKAIKESKNDIVKEIAYDRINTILEEIEQDVEMQALLMEKYNLDEKENQILKKKRRF